MNKDDAHKIAKLAVAPIMARSRALLERRSDRLKLSSSREGAGWRFTFAITEASSAAAPATIPLAPASVWLEVVVSADGATTVDERHALEGLLSR